MAKKKEKDEENRKRFFHSYFPLLLIAGYNRIPFEKITGQMVLFNIGSSFYSQSKFEDALKYYKRAIEIQKDFLDAIYWLGLSYIALGNNQEALATFESYLKYDSSSETANRVKGFIEFFKRKT